MQESCLADQKEKARRSHCDEMKSAVTLSSTITDAQVPPVSFAKKTLPEGSRGVVLFTYIRKTYVKDSFFCYRWSCEVGPGRWDLGGDRTELR